MNVSPTIVWFREDFRLADNQALHEATQRGQPLICLVILDDAASMGAAAQWWLDGAIHALATDLRAKGGDLHVLRGPARRVVESVVQATGAGAVFWNRRYDPNGRETDTAIKAALQGRGVVARSFSGALLHEPWTVRTQSGAPYKIFTAFWRAACTLPVQAFLQPAPDRLVFAPPIPALDALRVPPEQYRLLPTAPDWAGGLRAAWKPGEAQARARLTDFCHHNQAEYAQTRDFPAMETTSRLSPFLRFGHVSPARVWETAQASPNPEKFLTELGWRDFAWSLLFETPDLASRNLRPEFDAMKWRTDPERLAAWQRGRTGYPLVDAGMRELWHTGVMHNRVRMVVASFLVKHLLIDWREGERWFADTLVDHDPASNPMNWQWSAGTGVDAAPYFRIMNPVLQSRKFDPHGSYIRRWVPEVAHLSDKDIHAPWEVGCRGYVAPVVDHAEARARALAAWKAL
ncbi:MAG: DNA photolyase family protein [Acetobacter peroxydans]|jgi:deoxyribodipyrimidine photo-lyase|nr:DNA photolyase family protein [Acetobacter peroxydans]MCI2078549.1 DNA photolyase family protein [Acetobacter peroxydans]